MDGTIPWNMSNNLSLWKYVRYLGGRFDYFLLILVGGQHIRQSTL